MRFLIGLLVMCIGVSTTVFSQELTVTERCFDHTAQPVALSEADFSGTLYTSHYDGIRAIRSTMDTTYFIAKRDHYKIFGDMGSFSPDGKWFAYPTGSSEQANSISRHYLYNHIHFVNTYTGQEVFSIPTDQLELFVSGISFNILPSSTTLGWLDSTHYLLDDRLLNVITQETTLYSGTVSFDVLERSLISTNGDFFIRSNQVLETSSGEEVDFSTESATWINENTFYYVTSLGVLIIKQVPTNSRESYKLPKNSSVMAVSSNDRWVFLMEFIIENNQSKRRYALIDTDVQQIFYLCDDIYDVTFSPDSSHMAMITFEYDPQQRSLLSIIDLATWQATPIDIYLNSTRFIRWWE